MATSLTLLQPFNIDTANSFTFANVTITSNVTSNNANLGNAVTANYFLGNGSQLSGITASTATTAATVTTNAQPNITSTGTLSALTVTGVITATSGGVKVGNIQDPSGTNTLQLTSGSITVTGNITAGGGGSGNVTATYFIGNGSLLTSTAGANVTGQVGNALIAGTVYTNAQPNITSVGTLTSLTVTGNVTSGNANLGNAVVANYFVGNGSLLTGLPASYSNTNVAAYLPTYTGNFTAGNANVTGNIIAGNVSTSGSGGNITGVNYLIANYFTGTLTTAAQPNITSTGTLTSLTVTGNITSGNANLGNLVTANFFTGNGYLLTGLPASYSNTNVAAYLPTYTGNITAGNANVTGNITATYFIGNGSQLTGLPASYSNTNVAAYLPTYTGNITAGNANVTGNITAGNLSTSGAGGNITGANYIIANYFSGNGSLLTSITGANITGYAPLATAANTAGTVTTGAQPNITSTGTLASITHAANANITMSGTLSQVSGANLVSGTYISGNGSLLTSITGANVTGYVPNANIANTAYAVAVANVVGIGNIATINKDGNTSNVLYGNGVFSSAPTDSGTYSATASGGITAGAPVIINTDGTVSITGAAAVGPGTAVRVDTNYATSGEGTASAYDSVNNKILAFYTTQSGAAYTPYLAVGTVSSTTTTWAYINTFNNGQNILSSTMAAVYDPISQKSVVFYNDQSTGYPMAQVMTTNSGAYPTAGVITTIVSDSQVYIGSADYDSVSGKILVAVCKQNTTTGSVYVGTISGSTISFGTAQTYSPTGGTTIQSRLTCYNNKVVIIYGNYSYRYVKAGTVSGTSITFGTQEMLYGAAGTLRSLDYSSSDNTYIATYNDSGSYAMAFTVSGTTITLGTQFTLDANSNGSYVRYSPALKKFTIFKQLTARVVTLTGTTITTGGNITLLAEIGTNTPAPTIVYNSANSVYVMVGIDNTIGTGASVYAYVFHPAYTSLTSTNYIGMSSGTYSSGATATIQLAGSTNTSQTGLTAGQAYYVQPYGTISTTPGTPSVFAGTAVSATKIIVLNTTLGANISATYLTVTANITSGNANLGNLATSNYFTGNGSLLTSITGANITGYAPLATAANTAGTVTTAAQPNITSTGTLASTTIAANANITMSGTLSQVSGANLLSGTYLTGTLTTGAQPNITSTGTLASITHAANANITMSGSLSQISGANLVSATNLTGTVTTAAQPNITSTGTLVSVTVSGDATITGNLTVSGSYEYANVTSFNVKDPIIEQGGNPNGTPLASNDGKDRGQILHYYSSAAIDGFMGWDNSNAEFAFGSNVSVSSEVITFNNFGNVRAGYYLGNGSQLSGVAATTATTAGTVTTAAQPNITSVGTLSSLTITGNVTSGNANLGNAVVANYFVGNGSLLTGLPASYSNTNVAAYLPTYTGNASANYFIGNGATLTYITGSNVSGNVTSAVQSHYANIANSVAGGNISGQVGNSLIAGTVYTNAQPNITSVGTLTSLSVTGNISSGNANLGNLITSNYSTAVLTTGAQPNITSVGTLTSLSVTGNISSGNANLGNLIISNYSTAVLTTGAQPNITSVGTLTSVTVTGNVTAGNIKSDNLLYANGTAWSFSGGGVAVGAVQVFTADGSGNTYTLTTTPSNEDQITVNIDGVIQLHSSFSLSGNVVTISGTPVSGAAVEITNFNSGGAAGSNTQIQFNDGGNIAGTAALTFNKTSNTLNATNITANGAGVATTGKAIAMAIVFGF